MRVGFIVGSLRKDSWNRKVANVVKEMLPAGVEADFIDIANLPFYNEDLDGEQPAVEYTALRDVIGAHDAFIFFMPEYNRSYAPAIKNAIDIASRGPLGNMWAQKPVALFTASTGNSGGMAGNHALRQVFVFVDMIAMQQPEVYLPHVDTLFSEDGRLQERTKDFLQRATDAFIAHAKRFVD